MAADCGFIHLLGPNFRLCMFKNYFASISYSEGNLYWRICLINHNGSVHLHTPIHPSQTALTNCLQLIGSQQEHCLKKLMLGSYSRYPSLGGVHFIADSFEIVAVIEV